MGGEALALQGMGRQGRSPECADDRFGLGGEPWCAAWFATAPNRGWLEATRRLWRRRSRTSGIARRASARLAESGARATACRACAMRSSVGTPTGLELVLWIVERGSAMAGGGSAPSSATRGSPRRPRCRSSTKETKLV